MIAVADHLFLLAHDEHSGRARAHPRTLGVGLAGALVAELVLPAFTAAEHEWAPNHLRIDNGVLTAVSYPRSAPADALQHWVFETIAYQRRGLSVETWLRMLAHDSTPRVADRLIRRGLICPIADRRVFGKRRKAVHRPVDPEKAAYLTVHLRGCLDDPSRITVPVAVVLGLVTAMELLHHIVLWDGREVPHHVRRLLGRLPDPLREVISHTEAAIATAVLAH